MPGLLHVATGKPHFYLSCYVIIYREFDTFDASVRRIYPRLKNQMPVLPPKQLFGTASVVRARQAQLVQYMTVVIDVLPEVWL